MIVHCLRNNFQGKYPASKRELRSTKSKFQLEYGEKTTNLHRDIHPTLQTFFLMQTGLQEDETSLE